MCTASSYLKPVVWKWKLKNFILFVINGITVLKFVILLQHLCTFRGRKKVVISSFPDFKDKVQVTAMYPRS